MAATEDGEEGRTTSSKHSRYGISNHRSAAATLFTHDGGISGYLYLISPNHESTPPIWRTPEAGNGDARAQDKKPGIRRFVGLYGEGLGGSEADF